MKIISVKSINKKIISQSKLIKIHRHGANVLKSKYILLYYI